MSAKTGMAAMFRRFYQRASFIDILEERPPARRLTLEQKFMRKTKKIPEAEYSIEEAISIIRAYSCGNHDISTVDANFKCTLDNAMY
jgi:hypothetical protein